MTPAIDFLGSWDLEQAARSAEALAAEIEGDAGGQRAKHLAQVLRVSSEFLGHFEAAVGAGAVTFSRGDDQLPVLGFQRSGPEHGLTVNIGRRSRPRRELVPRAELRAEHWVELANLTDAPDHQKTAFLAVASLTDHLGAARAYLGRIDADRDESGVGDEGYPLNPTLMEDLLSRLPDEAWAEFLGHELRAGIRLVDGLVALSQNRPRAGAAHLDQLLEEFPSSILVHALR